MNVAWELAAVGALILLNGYFVAAEYALVTVRRTRIHELAHAGDKRARRVLKITSQPPRFIAAMQLGVTLTSLAIGAVGEPVPKGISLGSSETVALRVAAPVRAFFFVFRPLIWVLQRSTELVLR